MPTYNNGAGYFLYVGDISEVYNYNVPSGGTMFFMNKNQPVLYLKSVNMFNQQTVTEYNLVEKPATPAVQNPITVPSTVVQSSGSQYVTRDELAGIIQDTIRDELRNNRGYKNNRKEQD